MKAGALNIWSVQKHKLLGHSQSESNKLRMECFATKSCRILYGASAYDSQSDELDSKLSTEYRAHHCVALHDIRLDLHKVHFL